MFSYAVGLPISGYLADKLDVRWVVAFGMMGASVVICIFGVCVTILKVKTQSIFVTLWFLNGLFQSSGWPGCVKIMGLWFADETSGRIFGLWAANASAGNLIGAGFVSALGAALGDKKGILYFFIVPGAFLFVVSLLVLLILPAGPQNVDLPKAEHIEVSQEGMTYFLYNDSRPPLSTLQDSFELPDPAYEEADSISFCQAVMIPGVITYALCYACLKGVNYAMFFWLPYYLKESTDLSYTQSSNLSMLYDIGQMVGGFMCGWISDIVGQRSPPVWVSLMLSTAPIFALRLRTSIPVVGIICFTGGLLVGGPANLISSAISADLGKHESLKASQQAMSSVAGIIDGTASLGAAGTQYMVAAIPWHLVFLVLAAMLLVSACLIFPIFCRECQKARYSRLQDYAYHRLPAE